MLHSSDVSASVNVATTETIRAATQAWVVNELPVREAASRHTLPIPVGTDMCLVAVTDGRRLAGQA